MIGAEALGKLIDGHGGHLCGVGGPRDEGGHPAQRGLLRGQGIGVRSALFGFGGTQSGLPDKDIGQQRQREEHRQRGGQAVPALQVQIGIHRRTCERGRDGQSDIPARRDHQHTEQEQRTERILGGNLLERGHRTDLGDQEQDCHDDADADRARGGAHHLRQHSMRQGSPGHRAMVAPRRDGGIGEDSR
ncbi:hypothetical protein MYFR107205_10485 [Mycolicibacterium frederiksbergense]